MCDLILRRLEPCGDNSSRYAALPTSAPGEPRASEAKLSLRNTLDMSVSAALQTDIAGYQHPKSVNNSTSRFDTEPPSSASPIGKRTADCTGPPYPRIGKLHVLTARRRRRRNASSGRAHWLADHFATGSYLSKAHRQPCRNRSTSDRAIRPSIRPQSDRHLWHIAVNIAFCSSSLSMTHYLSRRPRMTICVRFHLLRFPSQL